MKNIINRISLLALALALTVCFAACGETPDPDKTPDRTLVNISVTTAPATTTYYVGDTFDPTGAKITITYSDSKTDVANVTAAMCSAADMTTAGDKFVTVSYTEGNVTKQDKIKITVLNEADKVSLEWNSVNYNMFTLSFELTRDLFFNDWQMELDKDDLAAAWVAIGQEYVKIVTGTPQQAAEAAKKIGDDVFAVFYGMNNGQKILLTDSGNPVLKHKGWSGWLNSSETEHWYPNGEKGLYINATLEKGTTMMTSVSGLDDAKYNWSDIRATGKLYADLYVVRDGRMAIVTKTLEFN